MKKRFWFCSFAECENTTEDLKDWKGIEEWHLRICPECLATTKIEELVQKLQELVK